MIPGIGAVHPSLQPQTRFVIALAAIAANVGFGLVGAFDDGLKEAGYTDPADFWEDLLSENMKVGDLIHDMASFHSSRARDSIKMTLGGLFKQAALTDEPFILKNAMIEPRGAVCWLLSKPRRRALVPVELARHIEGVPKSSTQTGAGDKASLPRSGAKGGRPPAAD
jgi:hypothetical protein